MKTRILALLLTAALLVGMLPAAAMAKEAATPVYLAAFADDVSADGALSEVGWLTDGRLSDGTRFGVLWNSQAVYIAVAKTGALTVKLGEQTLTVAADGTATGIEGASAAVGTDVVEICIPFIVTDYSHAVAMTLAQGEASWEGSLTFSSQVRENVALDYAITGTAPVESANLSSEEVSGGFRMRSFYVEDSVNAGNGRVYEGTANSAVNWLANRTSTLTTEYDFRVDAMPEYASWSVARTHCCFGFSMAITDATGVGYVAGITNTAEGLRFCVLNANGETSFLLGKTVDETFRVRQDWTMDGDLAVYVDGEVLEEGVHYTLSEVEKNGSQRICVSIGVNANKMCDVYTVQVVDKDGNAVRAARSMSVRYCIDLSLNTMDEADKACAIAMLDYGAMAQIAFDSTDTDLANRYIER